MFVVLCSHPFGASVSPFCTQCIWPQERSVGVGMCMGVPFCVDHWAELQTKSSKNTAGKQRVLDRCLNDNAVWFFFVCKCLRSYEKKVKNANCIRSGRGWCHRNNEKSYACTTCKCNVGDSQGEETESVITSIQRKRQNTLRNVCSATRVLCWLCCGGNGKSLIHACSRFFMLFLLLTPYGSWLLSPCPPFCVANAAKKQKKKRNNGWMVGLPCCPVNDPL